MTTSISTHHPPGKSGLLVPPVIFGTSCLGNLYQVVPEETNLAFPLDDSDKSAASAPRANRGLALALLWLNIVVLSVAIGMIFSAFVTIPSVSKAVGLSDRGASILGLVGFVCFLAGRVIGAALLKKLHPHKVLGYFAVLAGVCSLLVYLKLGWLSAIALFLTYFFMSIMFPTIFSLGIHGLGARAKQASFIIVMAIMGGAIMPKLMGHIADKDGMSASFIVSLLCSVFVRLYTFIWSKFSKVDSVAGVKLGRGH